MFFKKKSDEEVDCINCNSKVNKEYSYCPHCSSPMISPEEEMRNFGMLGKNDIQDHFSQPMNSANLGMADKMLQSIMQSLVKSLDSQFKEQSSGKAMTPEIENTPNGIRIKLGIQSPQKKLKKKTQSSVHSITEEQSKKMSKLPRAEAKTNIKRLSDKVIYEVSASGVQSPKDIFISKTESGYEVKAIGKKKIYVNSLPINLPLKGYYLEDKRITFEFSLN